MSTLRSASRPRRSRVAGAFVLLLALAVPATARDRSQPEPLAAVEAELQAGEYRWYPERSTQGEVVLNISLPEQRLRVYRDAVEIGESTISSGRHGYETPTGRYRILQKRVTHFSNRYDNAPMPHMQRLTWDGIALHGGHVADRPASHGCIRLPPAFAKLLYAVTEIGTTVVILDGVAEGALDAAPAEAATATPAPEPVTGAAPPVAPALDGAVAAPPPQSPTPPPSRTAPPPAPPPPVEPATAQPQRPATPVASPPPAATSPPPPPPPPVQ